MTSLWSFFSSRDLQTQIQVIVCESINYKQLPPVTWSYFITLAFWNGQLPWNGPQWYHTDDPSASELWTEGVPKEIKWKWDTILWIWNVLFSKVNMHSVPKEIIYYNYDVFNSRIIFGAHFWHQAQNGSVNFSQVEHTIWSKRNRKIVCFKLKANSFLILNWYVWVCWTHR